MRRDFNMTTRSGPWLIFGIVWLSSAAWAQDDAAAELKKVQGRYEILAKNSAGVQFRMIKDVGEGREVVSTYDDVGNLVEAHSTEFKLEKRGEVRVFSFFNLTVLAGTNKGHVQPGTSSYLYRVTDNHFVEAWGLLEGDTRSPHMKIWRRLKDNE
jgi:hypothetical protein